MHDYNQIKFLTGLTGFYTDFNHENDQTNFRPVRQYYILNRYYNALLFFSSKTNRAINTLGMHNSYLNEHINFLGQDEYDEFLSF